MKICQNCKLNKAQWKFCSTCYRNFSKKKKCKRCGKVKYTIRSLCLPCYNKNGGYGIEEYRKKAIRLLPQVCSNALCLFKRIREYVPVEMLDVDHIDGNRKNNDIKNLQFLCAWCHTLKTRGVEN